MSNIGQSTTNVVDLEQYRDPAPLPVLDQIEDYWNGLRDGSDLPRRSDIDPRGLHGALESAFILERIAPGVGRFRVAGQRIWSIVGMEVRGMPLTSLFDASSRSPLSAYLEDVLRGPSATILPIRAVPIKLGRSIVMKMLMLPLQGENGEVDRILGGIEPSQLVPQVPHRLRLNDGPVRCDLLNTYETDPIPYQGFAEGSDGFEGTAPRSETEAPKLRLV